MTKRDAVIAVCVAAVSALLTLPLLARLDGLSGDILMMLRNAAFGQRFAPAASRAAVIAIDEESYRTPPFAGTPKVLWTPDLAKVIDAVLAGGAAAVGFDVVFPTSVEQYIPGFERPFLLSLRQGAREGRIVLGQVQHVGRPISPFPAQSMMVGHERNIRPLNAETDPDFVIRRAPLLFRTASGQDLPSMALEMAARTAGKAPERAPDGGLRLDGYDIPGGRDNAMRINFQGGNDIPTYSLADLYACAAAGNTEFFAREFRGKAVMLGEVLDVEDRKITGKRFMTGIDDGRDNVRCLPGSGAPRNTAAPYRDSIAGVYIHAAAINDLLRRDGLRDLARPAVLAANLLAALALALLTLRLRPVASGVAVVGFAAAWTAAGVVALQQGLLLPLLSTLMAAALAYGLMLGYRYVVVDQQKHHIRRLFSLYLAPAVVNEMVDSNRLPELGGEQREVTVWFSDLANFTALSEGLSPNELVQVMNHYFSAVTAIIESHGGFVDKYIGDAVVAIFGAPRADPEHAANAVRAVVEVSRKLAAMTAGGEFGQRVVAARTGINTGEALVGNVGGDRRFNYTVMGDTVNMASRLEGANKLLGSHVLLSDQTAAQLPPELALREIDTIRVKGRQAPVTVYEPLGVAGAERPAAALEGYAQALADYRRGDFAAAAARLEPLAASDPAAAKLHERAAAFAAEPPADWDGVTTLLEK